MTSRFYIVLAAGCRFNGARRFGSLAEQCQAEADMQWLVQVLGSKLCNRIDSLGCVTAELTAQEAKTLEADTRVLFIQPVGLVQPAAVQPSSGWALAAVSDSKVNSFTYENDGSGVTVWLLDSGVELTCLELQGRVFAEIDFTDTGAGEALPLDGVHGTEVASLIGGTIHGVAKGCTIRSVRVQNDVGGSAEWLVQGIAYVLDNASNAEQNIVCFAVDGSFQADFSQYSTLEDMAVTALLASGIHCVLAAGNMSQDVAGSILTSDARAIVVGAADSNNKQAAFSNYGSRVDLFAPGVGVDCVGPANLVTQFDGTSAAAGLVVGVLAAYLQGEPDVGVDEAKSILCRSARTVVKTGHADTTDRLIYNLLPPVPVRLSHFPAPGVYNTSVTVSLRSNKRGGVRYTLDGSEPTLASLLLSGNLVLTDKSVIRAKAFDSSGLSSEEFIGQYLIDPSLQAIATVETSFAQLIEVEAFGLNAFSDEALTNPALPPTVFSGDGRQLYRLNSACRMLVVNGKRCDQFLLSNAASFPTPLSSSDRATAFPESTVRLLILDPTQVPVTKLWLTGHQVPAYAVSRLLTDDAFGYAELSLDGEVFSKAVPLTEAVQAIWVRVIPTAGRTTAITFYDLAIATVTFSPAAEGALQLGLDSDGTVTVELPDGINQGVEFYEI